MKGSKPLKRFVFYIKKSLPATICLFAVLFSGCSSAPVSSIAQNSSKTTSSEQIVSKNETLPVDKSLQTIFEDIETEVTLPDTTDADEIYLNRTVGLDMNEIEQVIIRIPKKNTTAFILLFVKAKSIENVPEVLNKITAFKNEHQRKMGAYYEDNYEKYAQYAQTIVYGEYIFMFITPDIDKTAEIIHRAFK